MSDYDDIINTSWPRPSQRPRMEVSQRAKIFLPFSALTGYDMALEETLEKEIQQMVQKTGKIKFDEEGELY